MKQIKLLTPDWPAPKNVFAATTTRLGGISQGLFRGLNLGLHVGDDPQSVLANRAQLKRELQLSSEPIWLNQDHGTNILRVTRRPTSMVTADGLITSKSGLACCVMTADCMPLFLCDQAGSEVAVVHAGWRGMAAGIIEQAVSQFSAPAAELISWAGPTISATHFEVGTSVRNELGGGAECWRAGDQPGKLYADLYQLASERLTNLGVGWYGHAEACTFADEADFFSHRRDGVSGRLASLIYLHE